MIPLLFLASNFASPYVCTDNPLKQNYVNQNMCQLLEAIPAELKDLPYAIYPNDPKYNTARFIYNKWFNLFPHAIIAPRTVEEMAFVLKNLREHELPFSLRSGGHCYEPGSLSTGFVIDLANFNSIKPDVEKEEVVVGAGCLLGDLIMTLGELDYAVPTGDCPVVGVTGLSLGGGQGVLTRAFGMTCDSIKSIKMMMADGSVIEVHDQSYPDLFWAMRGAGNGSYGIVLELTFKMFPIPKAHFVELSWAFDPANITAIIEKWQSWLKSLPNEITTHMRLVYAEGRAIIKVSAVKVGSQEFNEWKGPFESLSSKVIAFSGRYVHTARYWVATHENPFSKSKSSIIMEPFNQRGIDVITKTLADLEKANKPFQLHLTIASMGGKSREGDTAYYPRAALAMMHDMVTWENPEHQNSALQTLSEFHRAISPYVSKHCYANIVDYELGEDFLSAYFGINTGILMEIKRRYDPANLFRWKQSIPLK